MQATAERQKSPEVIQAEKELLVLQNYNLQQKLSRFSNRYGQLAQLQRLQLLEKELRNQIVDKVIKGELEGETLSDLVSRLKKTELHLNNSLHSESFGMHTITEHSPMVAELHEVWVNTTEELRQAGASVPLNLDLTSEFYQKNSHRLDAVLKEQVSEIYYGRKAVLENILN